MNNLMLVAAVAFAGLSIAFLIYALRGLLTRTYLSHVEWMRASTLRFDPEARDPEKRVWTMYAAYAGLLVFLLILLPAAPIALLFWAATLLIPRFYVSNAWQQRRAQIDLQLPHAISTMCNSMRAGLTLVQSMQRLAESAPAPIRTEFKVMANQYSFGADMEQVLLEAKSRLNLPNFNLFASALMLNREMGGDISETLQRISKSLDKIREMRRTVEAHTSEGRTNIKVLLMAPIVMLLIISLVKRDAVVMLFTTSQGLAIMMIAGALAGSGVYIANRITKSDV